MNELTNSIPKDGRSLSELLESSEFDPEQWRVRQIAGTIVLEPIAGQTRIPPGYYIPETLPPLSEKARKILESVDAAVARFGAAKAAVGPVTLDDEPYAPIALTDEPLPGLDLDE